jgi:glycosyltransferase involved in cell wall biosynthesis
LSNNQGPIRQEGGHERSSNPAAAVPVPVEKPRIAWLVSAMGYGSQLLYWEPILRGYVSKYPNCRIFTSGAKMSAGSDQLPIKPAIKKIHIPIGRAAGDYNKLLILVSPGIIGYLRKFPPDLLVISEFGLLTLYGVIVSFFRSQTRLLLLVESDPRSLAHGVLSPLKQWVRRMICRRCNVILTNNEAGYRYLTTTLGVQPDKILKSVYLVSQPETEAAPGMLNSDIQSELQHERGDYVAFLYIGQLAYRKGLHNLVRAMSLLPAHVLGRCRVWIVGDGDEKAAIEKAIHDAGLADHIRLFGHQPYNNLPLFYKNADVFVFPTLHDYRALVGFEALSFGLPLLHSTGDGAVAEVVIENENGFTFAPDDIATLARHITWYIENSHMIPQFSRRSRAMADRFTVQSAVDSLVRGTELALMSRPRPA